MVDRSRADARARRCFLAFLSGMSTLLAYEINPWFGWAYVICLGALYVYMEVAEHGQSETGVDSHTRPQGDTSRRKEDATP